jgi:Ricin-type beta-trefoil lectin domain-like
MAGFGPRASSRTGMVRRWLGTGLVASTAVALALAAVIGSGSGPALAVPVTTDPGGGGGGVENFPACLSNATGSIHASLSSMVMGQSVEVDWSSQVPSGCTVGRTITGPGFDSQTLAGSGSRVVNPTSAGTATWTLWLWYASGGVDYSANMGSVSVTVESVPQEGLPVLQNTGNGKCLQPENESLFQGAAIVQEPCNGSDAQRWYPIYSNPANGNYVEGFTNRHSLLCLDARGGATNGTPVQQWTCNSISNEKWLAGIPPYLGQVLSRVSGTATHCLDNPNQSTQDGTAMQLFACNGTAAQSWFFGPSPV